MAGIQALFEMLLLDGLLCFETNLSLVFNLLFEIFESKVFWSFPKFFILSFLLDRFIAKNGFIDRVDYETQLNLFERSQAIWASIFFAMMRGAVQLHIEILKIVDGIVLLGCWEGLVMFFQFADFNSEKLDQLTVFSDKHGFLCAVWTWMGSSDRLREWISWKALEIMTGLGIDLLNSYLWNWFLQLIRAGYLAELWHKFVIQNELDWGKLMYTF